MRLKLSVASFEPLLFNNCRVLDGFFEGET